MRRRRCHGPGHGPGHGRRCHGPGPLRLMMLDAREGAMLDSGKS